MDWLNIHTSTLDSPEFIGAAPDERATWLCLLRYCAGQENGGTIQNCRDWGDRRWQQLCRVTKDEAESASELWRWDGSDLRVTFYPVEKEAEVLRNRANGSRGGRPRNNQVVTIPVNHPVNPDHNQVVNPEQTGWFDSAETEGKGKEGEGKEKGKEVGAGAPARTDSEWLADLAANAAYEGIEVAREHAKMMTWCETNRKQPSRRRFVNWLNHCDRPMKSRGESRFGDAF